MKWKLQTSNAAEWDMPYHDRLIRLLEERDIQNPEEWLNVSEKDELDAATLINIDLCCEVLHEILSKPDPFIYIQADSDTDGYTSAAIITKFLKDNGPYGLITTVALHEGKEHGIDLKNALQSAAMLVIVPDAGSSEVHEQEELLRAGKQFIVIDHHELSEGVSIENKPIINNQVGEYKNRNLSGAGLTMKFCQYYAKKYDLPFDEDYSYALAAVGIIADVMSLQEPENKYIISKGLKVIHKHPFFSELLTNTKGNKIENPTQKDIGWTLGPSLNAIIRLGDMEQKQALFDTLVEPYKNVISTKRGDDNVIVKQYQEMSRICRNIKAKQSRLVAKGMQQIQEEIDEGKVNNNNNLLVYIDKDQTLPFEMSGLIANKLLSLYKKPVILLKYFLDKNSPNATEEWRGSVRGTAAEGCENLKAILQGLSGVNYAEGHAFACGISIEQDSFDSFYAHAIQELNKIDFNSQLYLIDAISTLKDLDLGLANVFADDSIWGHGIEKPLFLLKDIDCAKREFMGADGQHIKIATPNVNIIALDNRDLVQELKENQNKKMDAIGEFSWDNMDGNGRLQFTVLDYELRESDNMINWTDF